METGGTPPGETPAVADAARPVNSSSAALAAREPPGPLESGSGAPATHSLALALGTPSSSPDTDNAAHEGSNASGSGGSGDIDVEGSSENVTGICEVGAGAVGDGASSGTSVSEARDGSRENQVVRHITMTSLVHERGLVDKVASATTATPSTLATPATPATPSTTLVTPVAHSAVANSAVPCGPMAASTTGAGKAVIMGHSSLTVTNNGVGGATGEPVGALGTGGVSRANEQGGNATGGGYDSGVLGYGHGGSSVAPWGALASPFAGPRSPAGSMPAASGRPFGFDYHAPFPWNSSPLPAFLAAAAAAASRAAPADTQVAQPAVVQPAVVQPAVVQPAVVQSAVVQPTVTQPAVSQPAVAPVTPRAVADSTSGMLEDSPTGGEIDVGIDGGDTTPSPNILRVPLIRGGGPGADPIVAHNNDHGQQNPWQVTHVVESKAAKETPISSKHGGCLPGVSTLAPAVVGSGQGGDFRGVHGGVPGSSSSEKPVKPDDGNVDEAEASEGSADDEDYTWFATAKKRKIGPGRMPKPLYDRVRINDHAKEMNDLKMSISRAEQSGVSAKSLKEMRAELQRLEGEVFTVRLGDSVELIAAGDSDPYVGKLLELDRERKRCKVHWYFIANELDKKSRAFVQAREILLSTNTNGAWQDLAAVHRKVHVLSEMPPNGELPDGTYLCRRAYRWKEEMIVDLQEAFASSAPRGKGKRKKEGRGRGRTKISLYSQSESNQDSSDSQDGETAQVLLRRFNRIGPEFDIEVPPWTGPVDRCLKPSPAECAATEAVFAEQQAWGKSRASLLTGESNPYLKEALGLAPIFRNTIVFIRPDKDGKWADGHDTTDDAPEDELKAGGAGALSKAGPVTGSATGDRTTDEDIRLARLRPPRLRWGLVVAPPVPSSEACSGSLPKRAIDFLPPPPRVPRLTPSPSATASSPPPPPPACITNKPPIGLLGAGRSPPLLGNSSVTDGSQGQGLAPPNLPLTRLPFGLPPAPSPAMRPGTTPILPNLAMTLPVPHSVKASTSVPPAIQRPAMGGRIAPSPLESKDEVLELAVARQVERGQVLWIANPDSRRGPLPVQRWRVLPQEFEEDTLEVLWKAKGNSAAALVNLASPEFTAAFWRRLERAEEFWTQEQVSAAVEVCARAERAKWRSDDLGDMPKDDEAFAVPGKSFHKVVDFGLRFQPEKRFGSASASQERFGHNHPNMQLRSTKRQRSSDDPHVHDPGAYDDGQQDMMKPDRKVGRGPRQGFPHQRFGNVGDVVGNGRDGMDVEEGGGGRSAKMRARMAIKRAASRGGIGDAAPGSSDVVAGGIKPVSASGARGSVGEGTEAKAAKAAKSSADETPDGGDDDEEDEDEEEDEDSEDPEDSDAYVPDSEMEEAEEGFSADRRRRRRGFPTTGKALSEVKPSEQARGPGGTPLPGAPAPASLSASAPTPTPTSTSTSRSQAGTAATASNVTDRRQDPRSTFPVRTEGNGVTKVAKSVVPGHEQSAGVASSGGGGGSGGDGNKSRISSGNVPRQPEMIDLSLSDSENEADGRRNQSRPPSGVPAQDGGTPREVKREEEDEGIDLTVSSDEECEERSQERRRGLASLSRGARDCHQPPDGVARGGPSDSSALGHTERRVRSRPVTTSAEVAPSTLPARSAGSEGSAKATSGLDSASKDPQGAVRAGESRVPGGGANGSVEGHGQSVGFRNGTSSLADSKAGDEGCLHAPDAVNGEARSLKGKGRAPGEVEGEAQEGPPEGGENVGGEGGAHVVPPQRDIQHDLPLDLQQDMQQEAVNEMKAFFVRLRETLAPSDFLDLVAGLQQYRSRQISVEDLVVHAGDCLSTLQGTPNAELISTFNVYLPPGIAVPLMTA